MRRRDVLGLVGAAATAGLAGCTGDAPTDAGPTDSPEPTDSPTDSPTASPGDDPTATPSPTPEPVAVTGREFAVTGVKCGTGESSATVSQDSTGDAAGRVTVEGVVRGTDTCHRARLVSAAVEDDTLRVAVEPHVPEESRGTACAECIVDVSYRAVVDYEGTQPFDVVVEHEGERVAESGPYPSE
jgi:hypothetical protein